MPWGASRPASIPMRLVVACLTAVLLPCEFRCSLLSSQNTFFAIAQAYQEELVDGSGNYEDDAAPACKLGESLCADSAQCYYDQYDCDGFEDCKNGSDEDGCVYNSTTTTFATTLSATSTTHPIGEPTEPTSDMAAEQINQDECVIIKPGPKQTRKRMACMY